MKRRRPRTRCIEPLEPRLLLTAGELIRNGSFEATVVSSDWANTAGSPWQAGLAGFTNYHGGTKYAFIPHATRDR